MSRESLLSRTFVQLADTLVEDFDVVEMLTTLADSCVEVLDVSAAGLMIASPDTELRVVASSSDAMRLVEVFEIESQEGPCFDCYRSHEAVLNQHLGTADIRWPRFEPVAIAAGFHSVHAMPMRLRGQVVGALNLFRAEQVPLTGADIAAGQALADVATIAILQHRATVQGLLVNAQLSDALTSRVIVEQAKGVLAERARLTMADAFSTMRAYARNHNVKLLDVAENVIEARISVEEMQAGARETRSMG